ncbi:MAG: HD-GYP domain-containing protein [Candidatus Eremiobacteraeota bacterium]|nr:HD-GYP domain-containing protein [Candidatus Eremiobacteraeota bacterium]
MLWIVIGFVTLSLILAVLGFLAGHKLGRNRRQLRLSPEDFRLLGEDYEIKMRDLIDENNNLTSQWRIIGKLIASLGDVRDKSQMCSITTRLLKENLHADYTAVLCKNGNLFVTESSEGIHVKSEEALVFDKSDPLIHYIDCFPEVIALAKRDRQFKRFGLLKEKIGEVLIMSMKMGGEINGILWSARKPGKKPFSDGDKLVLGYLGNAFGYLINNINLIKQLEERSLRIVTSLAKALEQKDEYTRGHSDHVAAYAALFAKHLGVSGEELKILKSAALLHDIGKIGIPDRILSKPGKLTDEEFEHIKFHPIYGMELLKTLDFLKDELVLILHHHEKFDGSGYPYGLKGNQIPVGAQLISLADIFDALTTDRPYRKGHSLEDAMKIMKKMSGENFQPALFEQFADFIHQQMEKRRNVA